METGFAITYFSNENKTKASFRKYHKSPCDATEPEFKLSRSQRLDVGLHYTHAHCVGFTTVGNNGDGNVVVKNEI